jgi:hypothetical protein
LFVGASEDVLLKQVSEETLYQILCIGGAPDYAGATLAELKQEILDFYPADGLEPESVEMSGARAKFLITVQILCGRIRLQGNGPNQSLQPTTDRRDD